jgi:hypothetical protein
MVVDDAQEADDKELDDGLRLPSERDSSSVRPSLLLLMLTKLPSFDVEDDM